MRPSSHIARICPLLIGLFLVLLTGCAGYRLGPTNGMPAGSRSIEIKPFINQTYEPRITEYVSNSLRKEVQRDGTFELETRDEGDILITGVITRFERFELAFQPSDVLTPRDYSLLLSADVVVLDRRSGKTTSLGKINGRTSIRIGNDLASAERQAIPLLAQDLARNLISRLADGNW